MKIKIREKEKIVCWIVIGFFAIMGILMMIKPLWATVEASEIVPATEPQIQKAPIVIDFIEVTRPTEPSEHVEYVEHVESIEKIEKIEKAPVKNETKAEIETQPQPEGETKPTEEPESESESESESEPELKSLGRFKLTAYCACSKCCGKSDGITASGTKAKQGRTIAVDPKLIPYGTKVVINGRTYVAEDCGGSIKQNRIDVFFNSHKDALNFGIQHAEVFIYVG